MAFGTKSPHDVTTLLQRRNLANIPRDQQVLLESENSWAIELKDTPHGSGHIPGHVLQTVKEAYVRRKTKIERPPKSSPQSQSPPGSTTSDGEQDEHDQELPQSPHSQPSSAASSPERKLSWPSSPSRSEFEHISPVKSQPDYDSPQTPTPKTPTPKIPISKISMPKDLQIIPSPQRIPQLRAAPTFDFPPSSCGEEEDEEEEDMKVELPQAQIKAEAPVNRTASRILSSVEVNSTNSTATTNTPPCAQPEAPVIPNTVQKPRDPPEGGVQRRSRRMKPIVFSDESPDTAKTTNTPPAVVRMPSTKTFTEAEAWSSTNSSSIIPATYHDHSPQPINPLLPSENVSRNDTSQQVTSSVVRADHEQPVTNNTTHEGDVRQITKSTINHDDQQLVSSVQIPTHQNHTLDKEQDRPPERAPELSQSDTDRQLVYVPKPEQGLRTASSGRMDPYTDFITVYPDYVTTHDGDLWYFVQACVCIQILLEQETELKECLYDDFIRAFSGEFIKYARSVGPGQDRLPADAFYNKIRGNMLFNRLCVKVENLEHILSSYPEEVARAKAIIRINNEREEAMKRRSVPPTKSAATSTTNVIRRETSDEDQPQRRQRQVLLKTRTSQTSAHDPSPMKPPARPLPQIRAASPDLESDAVQPEPIRRQPMQPPKSSAAGSAAGSIRSTAKVPKSSQYLDRLLSTTRAEQTTRKRSSEEQERLREYMRKRRAAGSKFLPSSSRA